LQVLGLLKNDQESTVVFSSLFVSGKINLNQADAGAYALWLTVGFAEYPKADKGMFGKKVVLGTNYERPIRFLSAEDKPVEVLQISGILLDMDGKILRAGAEGLFHEDTPFWVQVLELKTEMRDETVSSILFEQRREELQGQPLVWKVALHNLLANLLQKPEITHK